MFTEFLEGCEELFLLKMSTLLQINITMFCFRRNVNGPISFAHQLRQNTSNVSLIMMAHLNTKQKTFKNEVGVELLDESYYWKKKQIQRVHASC